MRSRWIGLLLILPVLAMVSAGCPTVEPTLTIEDIAESGDNTIAPALDSEGAFVGIYHPDAPFETGLLRELKEGTGGNYAVMMWFQPWGQSGRFEFDASAFSEVRREGVVPMISWEPWDPGPDPRGLKDPDIAPKYTLANLLRGDLDPYIRDWASDVATYGGPLLLRPMHEMNGNWYPWGGTVNGNEPDEYVKVWRHIHQIFQQEGATNVTWVWSINVAGLPREDINRPDVYYPGDEYVDWVGISGFNWGTAESWSEWESFEEIYGSTYEDLIEYGKPMMVTELGSVEVGGDKAAWIEEAFAAIESDFTAIKGVVWYDAVDEHRDFRVASSDEAQTAFDRAISADHFQAGIDPTISGGGSE